MPRTLLSTLYATDEDAFLLGGPDFAVIIPTSQAMAMGSDGVFSSGDLWTLSSASNGFAAMGVTAGMMVEITGPRTSYKRPQFLAVDSAGGNSVTLRRPGQSASAIGYPPGLAGGNTSVEFQVLTLAPQLEDAAFYLDEQFGIDPNVPYRSPSNVYDVRVFRRITVLRVFYLLYMAENRTDVGDFARKQEWYKAQYEEELGKVTLRWGPKGTTQPATTHFSTRIVR